jgi:archaellum biogenesis ATPase FlaH
MDVRQDVLPKLNKVKENSNGWIACCPAHDDKNPSLSIAEKDGKILFKCFAGCSYVQIVQALGINEHEQKNKFKLDIKRGEKTQMVVAKYDYTDETGEVLYQAVRLEPKEFRLRRQDADGKWIYNLQGVKRIPYHLPEIIEARAKGYPVFLCEGEKDADNLRTTFGVTATTTALGSNAWNNDYAEYFDGLDVIILPDNDEAGRKYANEAAISLIGTIKSVKIIPLPNLPEKGDVSDWIEQGADKEQLMNLAAETSEWSPVDYQEVEEQSTSDMFIIKPANTWMEEARNKPIPKMLFGEFWYEGEICILFADTNLGKSSLAVQIADSITKGKSITPFGLEAEAQKVLYFDFELSDRQFISRYSEQKFGSYTNIYEFDEKLLRVEVNPDGGVADNFAEYEKSLIASIEDAIEETGTKVLIIDNITYLKNDNEKAKDALPLMKALKSLKTKHNLSIQVLAHTPKIYLSRPITKNDLAGSKMLINFCDSAFSMGKSQLGSEYRYLIQVKQRNSGQVYDSDNVCYGRISKPDNFLMFDFEGYGAESEHIDTSRNGKEQEIQQVNELSSQGYTQRRIAEMTGHSLGKVNALVKETVIDPNIIKPESAQDTEAFYNTEEMDEINDMDGLET